MPTRTSCVALALGTLVATSASASLLKYDIMARVEAGPLSAPITSQGVAVPAGLTATYFFDADAVGSGYSTYSYYEGAIHSAQIQFGSEIWTLSNSTHPNFLAVWNDESIGSGLIFDGIWIESGLSGSALAGFSPEYMGFVLFSYRILFNLALTDLSIPQTAALSNFNTMTQGALQLRRGSEVARFDLFIQSIEVSQAAIVASPPTSVLALLGAALALVGRGKKDIYLGSA